MNGYLTLIIAAITLIPLIVFTVLGIFRGWRRELLRAATILLAGIVSIFLGKLLVNAFLNVQIDGSTVTELITNNLPEEASALKDTIIPVVTMLCGVISFLASYALLSVVIYVLFAIFKFLMPREKRGISSMLCGLGTGVLCGIMSAYFICVPLNGVLVNVGKIAEIEYNGAPIIDTGEQLDFTEYSEGFLSKIYSAIGTPLFSSISSGEDKNGNKTNLSTQVDILVSTTKIALKVSDITNIDFQGGELSKENVNEVCDILKSLDDIKGEMTPETKKAVSDLINDVASQLDPSLQIPEIDLEKINFTNEANLIENVMNYTENSSTENVNEIITGLSKSDLILPVLKSTEVTVPVTEEEKQQIAEAVTALEDVDEETVNSIKRLFGIE